MMQLVAEMPLSTYETSEGPNLASSGTVKGHQWAISFQCRLFLAVAPESLLLRRSFFPAVSQPTVEFR